MRVRRETAWARSGIVATELATNVVRHGGGGEMLVQVLNDGVDAATRDARHRPRPRHAAMSTGCLRDGYSTGGTPGTGLGAVSRLSTHVRYLLGAGRGHGGAVPSRAAESDSRDLAQAAPAPTPLQFGAICVAAGRARSNAATPGGSPTAAPTVSDDGGRTGWGTARWPPTAARRGRASLRRAALRGAPRRSCRALRPTACAATRGAVAACARLHPPRRTLGLCGRGQYLTASIVGSGSARAAWSRTTAPWVCRSPRPRQFAYDWPAGRAAW